MKLSVRETADQRGITTQGVRHWLKKGLKYSKRRELGRKEYIVIEEKDVDEFLNLTKD